MARPEAANPARRPVRSVWPLRRMVAVAQVTFRQMVRMRLWLLVPLAIAVLVVADVSSPRFEPIFEGIPAAVSTSLLVMAVLAVLVGVFIATHGIPSEIESKVAYTVCTKPLSRAEYVAGKTLGMSVTLLAMLAVVAAGAYVYIRVRADEIRTLAARRLKESRTWVAHPADLNAIEGVARDGPMQVYRYRLPSAGPEFAILRDRPAPGDADRQWILGNTGMKFYWDLAALPLADWAAAGTVELRLRLAGREADPGKPGQVVIGIIPLGGVPADQGSGDAGAEGPRAVRRSRAFNVPESGELRIPVVAAGADPGDNGLQAAPGERFTLQMYATGDGFLVGAGADAVRVVRPSGETVPVDRPPSVRIPLDRGRNWVVGRSALPRQTATFRFDAVPPGRVEGRSTAVEIGFSLESVGPATAAAKATFLNPATRQSLSFEFTPEGYHATILCLDRDFWSGGPLEVRLESLTDEDFLGLKPESVRLRTDGGPFAWNLAMITLDVWLFGTVLAAFSILLSTVFGWFVSALGGIFFLLIASIRDFIRHQTAVAIAADWLIHTGRDWPAWLHWEWLVEHLLPPVPNVAAMLPGEGVRMGEAVAMLDLADAAAWAGLAVIVMVLVGARLLRTREVGA